MDGGAGTSPGPDKTKMLYGFSGAGQQASSWNQLLWGIWEESIRVSEGI